MACRGDSASSRIGLRHAAVLVRDVVVTLLVVVAAHTSLSAETESTGPILRYLRSVPFPLSGSISYGKKDNVLLVPAYTEDREIRVFDADTGLTTGPGVLDHGDGYGGYLGIFTIAVDNEDGQVVGYNDPDGSTAPASGSCGTASMIVPQAFLPRTSQT